jgi:hypothetical protein
MYPLQSIFIALIALFIYRQIKNLIFIPKCIIIILIVINFLVFNNGKEPFKIAADWFIYEDARKLDRFNELVTDAYVFYVRKDWDGNYLFNSMPRYYNQVKAIYPMQRKQNPAEYDCQRVIVGQIQQIPKGEKILIMNMNEDKSLAKDTGFIVLLNKYGFDIVTAETGIDIGHYNRFNVYAIVPYPDTPQLTAERIKKETDITKYLLFINDPRYTVFVAVRDTASRKLNAEIMAGLSASGLKEDLRGKERQSYTAVIDRGVVGFEELAPGKGVSLAHRGTFENGVEYGLYSSDFTAKNACSIVIDGAEYAVNKRGLNFVVYDNERKEVIDSVAFDTHADSLAASRKRSYQWK